MPENRGNAAVRIMRLLARSCIGRRVIDSIIRSALGGLC